ncbi:hypothetical protein OIU85_001349 [Salix viminalis]|uniref:Uncharacterized protein n=2 Tax=Salix TaxID=40685 RepID=A0A9Q0VNL2_SALVM|nr:hypothetical protein OIU84_025520 [Salix udensis]KAJ6750803.1 hypothetical protein OIU85_001349 [Salix viminalis]
MAPNGRKRTRAKTTRRTGRRTQYEKQVMKAKSMKEASILMEDLPSNSSTTTTTTTSCNGCSKIDGVDFEGVDISASACSTPKAERFRIPEIQTCPPAPRKQRIISNCSLQRRPIAFFAPPDLELFFFYAIHDVSV